MNKKIIARRIEEEALLKRAGIITCTQVTIFYCAAAAPGIKPVNLAEVVGTDVSTVRRSIKTMRELGLVSVEDMGQPARRCLIYLTERGKRLVREIEGIFERRD